jgi:hypothetical protein
MNEQFESAFGVTHFSPDVAEDVSKGLPAGLKLGSKMPKKLPNKEMSAMKDRTAKRLKLVGLIKPQS